MGSGLGHQISKGYAQQALVSHSLYTEIRFIHTYSDLISLPLQIFHLKFQCYVFNIRE